MLLAISGTVPTNMFSYCTRITKCARGALAPWLMTTIARKCSKLLSRQSFFDVSHAMWSKRHQPLCRDLRTAEMSALPCLRRKINRIAPRITESTPSIDNHRPRKHLPSMCEKHLQPHHRKVALRYPWCSSRPPYIGYRRHACKVMSKQLKFVVVAPAETVQHFNKCLFMIARP